jgi:hypothetical protein
MPKGKRKEKEAEVLPIEEEKEVEEEEKCNGRMGVLGIGVCPEHKKCTRYWAGGEAARYDLGKGKCLR